MAFVLGGLTACGGGGASQSQPGYQSISAQQAKTLMDENPGCVILDVRTREEFEGGHIPGALLLPNEEIGSDEISQLPDKDQMILVYCRSGNRSKQAAQKLAELGYQNVYEFGGITSWPYETTTL